MQRGNLQHCNNLRGSTAWQPRFSCLQCSEHRTAQFRRNEVRRKLKRATPLGPETASSPRPNHVLRSSGCRGTRKIRLFRASEATTPIFCETMRAGDATILLKNHGSALPRPRSLEKNIGPRSRGHDPSYKKLPGPRSPAEKQRTRVPEATIPPGGKRLRSHDPSWKIPDSKSNDSS